MQQRRRLALLFILTPAPALFAQAPIRVSAGTNLQALVDRSPANSAFVLEAGVHRLQTIEPKSGQSFTGERGAILNGARVVTGFIAEGPYWWAPTPTQPEAPHGPCLETQPRCNAVGDVFFNGLALRPAPALAGLAADAFFYDLGRGRLYLARDPANALIEAAEASSAFIGTAANVTIRGLTIEKYASRAQVGAIMGFQGRQWIIEGNTVQYNHGVGISGGPRCIVRNNQVRYNGQLGVSADGEGGVFESNEIAFNNTRGYLPEWEAGGAKFAETDDLVVRGNYVHHNFGFGLWTDIDSRRTLYEDNVVTENDYGGILVSASQGATVRNNFAARNGTSKGTWLWGAQIMLVAAEDVEVAGNTVIVAAAGGNGITAMDQDRGAGRFGRRRLFNDSVHDNLVVYQGEAGASGVSGDNDAPNATVRFDRNTYIAPGGATAERWYWGGRTQWDAFRAAGQEINGRFLPPFAGN